MRKLLCVIPILLVFSAKAQFRHPVFNDTEEGYSIGVYGRYQLASNAISSELIWQAYQGKFLDRKKREAASNRLYKKNGLGVDLDYGIYARHIPDSAKGLGWYLNIADRTHANAKFTKDFFDLAMFGNAQFAGTTADLSDLRLNFITYKQYEVGLLKTVAKPNGTWRIGFGLSLLAGNRNLRVVIDQAELYTDPDGEFLEGEIHGSTRSSSLTSTQFFDANGLGMSGALSIAHEGKKFGIRLDAEDIGFIKWSQHLKHSDLDSVFHFEGVDVNLFGTGGNFTTINLDTVVAGFVTKHEGTSYTIATPGRIRLEGFYKLKDNGFRIYAGIQHRMVNGYVPYGYIGTSSPLPKGFFIDGRFAYGGFGSWNLGLELRKKFKHVFEVRIGTNNLEGYILPMVGTSQSAYVSLAAYF